MNISSVDTGDMQRSLDDFYSVKNTLRRRGLDVVRCDDYRQVIQHSDAFYAHMKSSGYRNVVRTVYETAGIERQELLERFPGFYTEDSLRRKVEQSICDNAVETDEDGRLIPRSGKEYGVTFEWLVAHIVKNEMSGISSFGVRIADLEVGGDYDVLARLEDVIVFIECKTGTIGQISRADIDRFISRDGEISPNLSLFILDRNGLTDDFCNMWGQAWGARGMGPLGPRRRSKRRRGVFYEAMPSKHVVTSEGNLVNNIRLSVNHYVTWVKPYGMVAPDETAHRDHYDEYEE